MTFKTVAFEIDETSVEIVDELLRCAIHSQAYKYNQLITRLQIADEGADRDFVQVLIKENEAVTKAYETVLHGIRRNTQTFEGLTM